MAGRATMFSPGGYLTEVFLSCKANARKSVALLPVSSPFCLHPQRVTDETDVTDLGQMVYQAGNLWLCPKPVRVPAASGRCRHHWADIQSHLYIRRGNRRLSLVALPGLPAASRGVKLPLLADTYSVFQSL